MSLNDLVGNLIAKDEDFRDQFFSSIYSTTDLEIRAKENKVFEVAIVDRKTEQTLLQAGNKLEIGRWYVLFLRVGGNPQLVEYDDVRHFPSAPITVKFKVEYMLETTYPTSTRTEYKLVIDTFDENGRHEVKERYLLAGETSVVRIYT